MRARGGPGLEDAAIHPSDTGVGTPRTEARGCFVRVDEGHIAGEDTEHIMIGGG